MGGHSPKAVFLLLTYVPSVIADNTNENLVSTDNTTHAHEKSNEAFFVAPNNAVNGNNSEDNYTRTITSCWWYVGNLACEDGEYYITAVYTFSFSQSVEYVNLSSISKQAILNMEILGARNEHLYPSQKWDRPSMV